jgi:type VI secretion system protein ImpA
VISDAEVDQLLAPVSGDAGTGANLEYDPSFSELERAAAGKEERYSGGELIPAEEPDWRSVRETALGLFARTKDLRVAMQLAKAETSLSGLGGLQAGMAVIRSLLERYWDEVHPRLDAEEAFDPVFRINALAPLNDASGLLGLVRKTALVEARSVGRFTFRDLDVAEERAGAVDGAAAPTRDLVKAALRETASDDIVARLGLLQKVREDLRAVESIFKDRAADAQAPDIRDLDKTLAYGIAFLESGIARDHSPAEASDDATARAAGGGSGASIGALRNRDDVKRVLEQVCDFLERSEPSNPAPLLIRRATRLLDRSFIDIIQDLAPEAYGQIEKLAGSEASTQAASQQ